MRVERARPQRLAMTQAEGDDLSLRSGAVGWFRCQLRRGQLAGPGQPVGTLHILDRRYDLLLDPRSEGGFVEAIEVAAGPVEYGQVLLRLKRGQAYEAGAAEAAQAAGGLAVRAPQPGRVYLRPTPEAAPYVAEGAEVSAGEVIALVEVMKTFTPFGYPGAAAGLPARAKVARVAVEDGAEVEAGDVLFEVEGL